jgi:class 3 adenylate cyclase
MPPVYNRNLVHSTPNCLGTVCNLAARLCSAAEDGQILLSARVAAAVEARLRVEEVGDLALKGLSQEVSVFNVAVEQRSQAHAVR